MAKSKGPKKRVNVEWIDDGRPVDLIISRGEVKTATYIVRVTDSNNRPKRADEAWISRIRKKQLIDYSQASIESKLNGITRVSFTYHTNNIFENEDDAQAKIRISVEGHLDGMSDYLPYKEEVLPAANL